MDPLEDIEQFFNPNLEQLLWNVNDGAGGEPDGDEGNLNNEPPGGAGGEPGGDEGDLNNEPPGGAGGELGPADLNALLETEMERLRMEGHLSEKLIQKVRNETTLKEKGEVLRKEIWSFLKIAFLEFMRLTLSRWNRDVEWYEEAVIADKIKKIAERIGALQLASSAARYAYHCRGNDRDVNLLPGTYDEMREALIATKNQLLIALWELSRSAARGEAI